MACQDLQLIILLSHLVCQPKASRVMDTCTFLSTSALLSAFYLKLQSLVGCWCWVNLSSVQAHPLHSHWSRSLPVRQTSPHFGGIPILTPCSKSILHKAYPSPHKGQWPIRISPMDVSLPRATVFYWMAHHFLVHNLQNSLDEIWNWDLHTWRARRDQRKRQITPES